MAVNTVGDFIKSVFPTLINKKKSVFSALFANDSKTGTIETIFNELEETRKVWEIDSANIYNQTGEQLEKTLALFSVLERVNSDTDHTILARLRLLFYRNGDKVWGDKWNILNLFKTFFNSENVWLINNTDDENLLINGDFENQGAWVLTDGASYEREARFEGTTGILFNSSGTLEQTVNVNAKTVYFLHFFLKGNVRVKITDNNGRYWIPKGYTGAWGNTEHWTSFASNDWCNRSMFFINDSRVSSVTVTFGYETGHFGFVDYVRLNKKTKASTFSLIAVFEGTTTDDTANLAPGTNDPIVAHDYDHMMYGSPGNADATQDAQGVSYLDDENTAAITEDVSPTVHGGNSDVEPMEGYDNMTYLDEQKALAPDSPVGYDGHKTVDYEKMSYFDNAFLFGRGGLKELYQGIMDIVQPAGVTSFIELLTRETDVQ